MVLKIPDRGIIVKLPAKVETDPNTGRLVTTFDELPQLPVAALQTALPRRRQGAAGQPAARAAATRRIDSFTPWSDPKPVLTTTSEFQITSGIGGGPCPSGGAAPFAPGFVAGTLNNSAASYSPMNMRVSRNDGEQEITRFSSQLPLGLSAKLAGVPFCPDASIELAKAQDRRAGGSRTVVSGREPDRPHVRRRGRGAGARAGARQGLHGRPVQRRAVLDRRDHEREGRPVRPRHRRRARGAEDRPEHGRGDRRRLGVGSDPAHHQGDRRARARHPRLHRPAELHAEPDQLRSG